MKHFLSNVWLQRVAVVLLVCFLAFVGGAFVTEFRLFPYTAVFKPAFEYMRADQERKATEKTATELSRNAPFEGKLTVRATPEALDGYTFFTFDVDRPSTARLIDMQGKLIHEWHRPLREIWPNPPQRAKPAPDSAIAWRYAELLPNGDIIATVKAWGDTPDGYGLVKLDKDSNVIWAVAENFHHHFSIAPDGRIFGIIHEWRDTHRNPLAGISFLPTQVLEDFILELSPDGKELSRVSLLEVMAEPGIRELLGSTLFKAYKVNAWDPMHPNDIEVVDAEFASHHPIMKPGMLLISLRDLDSLVLFDPATRSIVWSMRGAWVRQHDPDLLPGGNILLFDNLGNNLGGGSTRLLEIDLERDKVVWSYTGGGDKNRFRSERAGGQERLTNGNTLISEDDRGRVFEVNPAGKTVWEYRDISVHHAMRVAKDWIQFVPKPPVNTHPAAGPASRPAAARRPSTR